MSTKPQSKDKTKNDTTSDRHHPSQSAAGAAAFRRVEPELKALRPEEITTYRADLAGAVHVAFGAEPHIKRLRAQMVKLPGFDAKNVDHLQTYTLAAWHAYVVAAPPPPLGRTVTVIAEEARVLRGELLIAADALASRKLLDEARVEAIREGKGHIDTADDLHALSMMFSEAWPSVHDKTALTDDDLRRASALGTELRIALGGRDALGASSDEARADDRARAFTLLVRAYDACRRAVHYLRWTEGDADAIAPSLFRRRAQGRKSAEEDAPSPGSEVPVVATPSPNGTPVGPAAPRPA